MKKLLILLLGVSIFWPQTALADGMVIPPPQRYVAETEQKAVILYDAGVETLVLSITFLGDAADFGWLVPTPTRPEVGKSSDELFLSLAELTKSAPAPALKEGARAPALDEGVTVLETKEVGIYEISVLKADDPQALSSWLSKNNYNFPEQASYLLEDYIANKWYFTAVKVRPDLTFGEISEQLHTGHATPLKLTFASEKIVYPLKISSAAHYVSPPRPYTQFYPEDRVSILLYFLADCEKELPGFQSLYAGELEKEEVEELAFNDDGSPWVEAEHSFILTKLYRRMRPVEMTADLYPRSKSGGLKVELPKPGKPSSIIPPIIPEILFPTVPQIDAGFSAFYFVIALTLWLLSPISFVFAIASLAHFLVKTQLARALAWFFQGLSLLGWFLVMFLLLVGRVGILREELLFVSQKAFSAALTAGVYLFLLMVGVLIFQLIRTFGARTSQTSKKPTEETASLTEL